MSEPLTDNQIEIRRKALTEPWNSNGSIGERELSYIATIDALKVEIESLTRERDAADAGAQQETDGIVHTLRSMAKNLKPEFAQMMNVVADAFEKFPRPKSSALEQVKAQAMLEEAKLHHMHNGKLMQHGPGCGVCRRIADLEAAARRKS